MKRSRSITWDELATRSLQEANKLWDVTHYRLGLRSVHPNGGILSAADKARFFFAPADIPALVSQLRSRFPVESEQIIRRADRICRHDFDLLGYEGLNLGNKIDWRRDPVNGKQAPRKPWFRIRYLDFEEVGDSKITWELNRHQHLVTLAKAFLITSDARFTAELFAEWFEWQRENPYPIGLNWASSLEVAFRSISWLWVWNLLSGSGVVSANFAKELSSALDVSGRHIEKYLSTYFSPNTHLLGEALALFYIGTTCPNLSCARLWQDKGWKIILQSAREQVRPDGMYFEQSTYYHVYALDMFLHARILASRNGIPIPPDFDPTIESMLDFLATLAQAGSPPRLGDDDGGRLFDPCRNRAEHMLDPLATGAALFNRADYKAAVGAPREEALWLLGVQGVAQFDSLESARQLPRSVVFKESGIYVMADSAPEPAQLVIDAGPQGSLAAGHGHADALSIHFAAHGQELLIDPGTFQYASKDNSRDQFRSTAAHNTLQVDQSDQSAPKGPFSWQGLADTKIETWIAGKNFELFRGSHSGYARLSPPVIHCRWVFHLKSRFWLVRDVAAGTGKHSLDLFWHFAPGFELDTHDVSSTIGTQGGKRRMAFLSIEESGWTRSQENGCWSPVYGKKETAPVLRFHRDGQLPAEIYSLLMPISNAAGELGRLLSPREALANTSVSACIYENGPETHQMIFADAGNPWRVGPLEGDAEFAYCRLDKAGLLQQFIVCGGSFAKIAGHGEVAIPPSAPSYEWPENDADPAVPLAQSQTLVRSSVSAEKKSPVLSGRSNSENQRGNV